MGFLDDIGGMIQKGGGLTALTGALGQGGLQNILTQLEAGGLGSQVKSWLGNGTNMPITQDQLRTALGNEKVQALATKMELSTDDLLKMLSQHLPTVVDQASPNGQLPPT